MCSICANSVDVSTNAKVVERATGADAIPLTMVKIMTLECHVALEVNAIPSSQHAYNSPQLHVFLEGRAFLLVWEGIVLYSASLRSGVEHEHLRFDISASRFSNARVGSCDGLSRAGPSSSQHSNEPKAFTIKRKWRLRKFPLCSSSMMTPTCVHQYKAY